MYDYGRRRRSRRNGRERGCWVYIPQEELAKAGFGPDEEAPLYRTWGQPRGGVFLRLYRQAPAVGRRSAGDPDPAVEPTERAGSL